MLQANKKSHLLNSLNRFSSDPFHYDYGSNVAMGTKERIIVAPHILSTSSVYGQKFVFDIPKNMFLAEAFIKSTITCTGDNTQMEDRFGTRVFKDISLETRRGPNVLQNINYLYSYARVDNLPFNVYSTIADIVEPETTPFYNITTTVFTPCFFYFSEKPSLFINTDVCEDLQITCVTNDNKTAMGLPADLTNLSVELHLTYFRVDTYPVKNYVYLIPGVYIENSYPLASGATTATVNIECDKTVFCMHILCLSALQEVSRLKTFQFRAGNQVLLDIDRRTNLNLWSPETYNNLTGTYTYWFSLYKDRTVNTLSQNLENLDSKTLTVTFTAVPNATYSLYVVFEYFNFLSVDSYGFIKRNIVN